jgi:hypothetical protein
MRRSYCSTAAIPAWVTCTDTGFDEPAVAGTSAPDDEVSNFCAIAFGKMRWVSPVHSTM